MKKTNRLLKKVASKTFSIGSKPSKSLFATRVYSEKIKTLYSIENIFHNLSANFIEMAKAMDATTTTLEETKESLKQQISEKQRAAEEASLEKTNLQQKISSKLAVPVAGESSGSLFEGIASALSSILDVLGSSPDIPDVGDGKGKGKNKGKGKPKGRGKLGRLGRLGRMRIPPGLGKVLSVGGRILGGVGLVAGAYEASEYLRETGYGERMAKGEGSKAEQAFKNKKTYFSQEKLTPQQAKDILDQPESPGKKRDIESFGGKEQLEKIAGLQKPPVTTPIPNYNFPDTGIGGGRGRVHPDFVKTEVKATFTPSQLEWLGGADPTDPAILARMPPPLPGEVGGPQKPQIQVAPAKPAPAPQAAPVSKPTVTTNAPVVTPPPSISVSQDDKETMAMIMKHEGVRTKPYKDSLGLWTVGVGHLIGDGKTLPPEWNREFTMDEVNKLFYDDYMSHKAAAMKIPGFNLVNAKAQGALIDLTFNMGNYWYKNWNKFKAAMANGDVMSAAAELENSKWYTQVKSRAVTIVSLIKQGATNAVGIPSSPTTGIQTAQTSAEVGFAKRQQPGQTTYNINNSTTTAVKVEGASQGGSVTVARPVATA